MTSKSTAGPGSRPDGTAPDPVVRYLAEVDAALAARGIEDRTEIVGGLREHILDATQHADPVDGPADGATVDAVLRDLGDPQLIAAEAASEQGAQTTQTSRLPRLEHTLPRPSRWREPWVPVLALGLLFVGTALFPFVLPIALAVAGLVLVWGTSLWTVPEKVLATVSAIVPGLAVWVAYSVAVGVETCSTTATGQDVQTVCTTGPVDGARAATVVIAAFAVAGLVGMVVTTRRALRRARR